MSDVALPKIKVTDAQNLDGSAAGTSAIESPSTNTTDGGQSTRPRSATSSEGSLRSSHKKISFAQPFIGIRHDLMIWLLVAVATLMLMTLLTAGNAQSNTKKSPVKVIRNNTSSKDGNVEVPSTPPAPARPPTAIDPLSHVRRLSAPL